MNWPKCAPCIAVVLLLISVGENLVSSEIYFKKGSPQVALSSSETDGILSGKLEHSREGRPFTSFIGIPYASVPTRFAESALVKWEWAGVKSASEAGPICVQADFWGTSDKGFLGEEDCLNLNVHVPMTSRGNPLPVMVWIHGGGYVTGSGIEQGPQFFMDEDVILITINYRLGIFGFLSTGDEVIPGNNGLKDMVIALKWVQENIQKFNGDPKKVTIFGQSAGAAAVHALLLSPTSSGLIHRAISQSGASVVLQQGNLARETAVELAEFMKCPIEAGTPAGITSEEIRECFVKASIADLKKAELSFKTSWPMNLAFPFNPSIESADAKAPFITEMPYKTLKNQSPLHPDIPWMVGMTEDEGACIYSGYILSQPNLIEEINSKWDDLAPEAFAFANLAPKSEYNDISQQLRDYYFNGRNISIETKDELTNIYSDYLLGYYVYKAGKETALKGGKVFLYQYAWHGPISISEGFLPCLKSEDDKVIHSDDIIHQFVISHMKPEAGELSVIKRDSEHEAFSKNFVKLWASFAEHGEPLHTWGTSPNRKWHPISKEEAEKGILNWYRIEENPGHLSGDPSLGRLDFWDRIYKQFEPTLLSN